MLSDKTLKIVKSTAPILQEHGETLTRHFYKRMFEHNPEVIPFFNHSNQGAGTQQKALANAICAFAANVDNLGVLAQAVELIAQKHASLQIKSEHYPIVGSNLLSSIKEVLGSGATDDVISAWAEAYNFLANVLIGREKQIYSEHKNTAHGWEGFKEFRLIQKKKESDIITSFYLMPKDGSPVPEFKAGQYITIQIPDKKSGLTTMRNYSLSNKPGEKYFRISVKREKYEKHGKYEKSSTQTEQGNKQLHEGNTQIPDGYVSNWLHDSFEEGAILKIAPPCGEFFLNTDISDTIAQQQHRHHPHDNHHHQEMRQQRPLVLRPLVLLAGGIGITPIMSILLSSLEKMPSRKVFVVHACLNEKVQAFRGTLDELAKTYNNVTVRHCYSDSAPEGIVRLKTDIDGFVDGNVLETLIPDKDAEYYFCGPKPFMVKLYQLFHGWDIPKERLHFEFFGPRQELEV